MIDIHNLIRLEQDQDFPNLCMICGLTPCQSPDLCGAAFALDHEHDCGALGCDFDMTKMVQCPRCALWCPKDETYLLDQHDCDQRWTPSGSKAQTPEEIA